MHLIKPQIFLTFCFGIWVLIRTATQDKFYSTLKSRLETYKSYFFKFMVFKQKFQFYPNMKDVSHNDISSSIQKVLKNIYIPQKEPQSNIIKTLRLANAPDFTPIFLTVCFGIQVLVHIIIRNKFNFTLKSSLETYKSYLYN